MMNTAADMHNEEHVQNVARAAQLYFLEGWSQQEIAQELSVSRSKVSRMLSEARETGIVEVTVHFPWARNFSLEAQLVERYELKAARVLRGGGFPYEELLNGIGYIGAEYLQDQLFEGMMLAISRGAAIHALVQELKPRRDLAIQIVQMQGALGDEYKKDLEFSNLLYSLFGANYRPLNAPSVMASAYACEILRKEPSIRAALNSISKADIAVFGIGSTAEEVSGILHTGLVTEEELADMRAAGIVADIAGRHFDKNGIVVQHSINDRIVGCHEDTILAIPHRIGVAGGTAKIPAIAAALAGGYLHALVTDSGVASALLS